MRKELSIALVLLGIVVIIIIKMLLKNEVQNNQIQKIHKEIIDSVTSDIKQVNKQYNEVPWFINTQYGLVFETPKAIEEDGIQIPQGTENMVKKVNMYSFNDKEIVLNYMVMETVFPEYNPKEGLRGSATNLINGLNGTNLVLEFEDGYDNVVDQYCNGYCYYKDVKMKIKGYCMFNKGYVYMLLASGVDNESVNTKLERIFNSINIVEL